MLSVVCKIGREVGRPREEGRSEDLGGVEDERPLKKRSRGSGGKGGRRAGREEGGLVRRTVTIRKAWSEREGGVGVGGGEVLGERRRRGVRRLRRPQGLGRQGDRGRTPTANPTRGGLAVCGRRSGEGARAGCGCEGREREKRSEGKASQGERCAREEEEQQSQSVLLFLVPLLSCSPLFGQGAGERGKGLACEARPWFERGRGHGRAGGRRGATGADRMAFTRDCTSALFGVGGSRALSLFVGRLLVGS